MQVLFWWSKRFRLCPVKKLLGHQNRACKQRHMSYNSPPSAKKNRMEFH